MCLLIIHSFISFCLVVIHKLAFLLSFIYEHHEYGPASEYSSTETFDIPVIDINTRENDPLKTRKLCQVISLFLILFSHMHNCIAFSGLGRISLCTTRTIFGKDCHIVTGEENWSHHNSCLPAILFL